ncbi:MAG: hypothetical protein WCI67_13215 [Chloroflexales bacterium]
MYPTILTPTAHPRLLWRLETAGAPAPSDPARLLAGLRLHLDHAPLTTVLVQIGARRQGYVALRGCAGCVHDRCAPGCPGELLRRLLAQAAPALTLRPVPRGLAARPTTRVVLATPGRHPQPLDAALLTPWPEARLVIGWRTHAARLQAGALLAVGADDPSPEAAVQARGWRAWPLPARLTRRWAQVALPTCPLHAGARNLTPTLCIPDGVDLDMPTAAAVRPEIDARLANWLTLVMARPTTLGADTAPAPEEAPPSRWPMGPQGLAPVALGALVAQILAEPSFQSTRKGQSGITKGRLAGLKYPGLSEPVARSLVVWFDRAGVLAPPEDGQGPWRAPRPFALTDLDRIATTLRATPLPTNEDVHAAYGGIG